jgi:hypothetical protein
MDLGLMPERSRHHTNYQSVSNSLTVSLLQIAMQTEEVPSMTVLAQLPHNESQDVETVCCNRPSSMNDNTMGDFEGLCILPKWE